MSNNLRNHYHHLMLLTQELNNKKLLKALVSKPDVVQAISEVVHNALCGNIEYNDLQKKKLKKYKKHMYILQSKKKSQRIKHKTVVQGGNGFLGALLVPAISVLANLLA